MQAYNLLNMKKGSKTRNNFANNSLRFSLQYKYYEDLSAIPTQMTFTCSKLTIETLEQVVKYVQS